MKEYIEKVLHRHIEAYDYTETGSLPLACRKAFEFTLMRTQGVDWVSVEPFERMTLTELRKYMRMLEKHCALACAVYLKDMNYYMKDKMIEEGIAFVWENHEVYLPFLGVLVKPGENRVPTASTGISFLTQKLLLKALYENWQGITVSEAAELLQVSKMSVTRCFDEIQLMDLPYLKIQSRARKFYSDSNKKLMWETIRSFLRNPVIASFNLEEDIEVEGKLGGISALGEYSLIDDNGQITYVIEKKQMKDYDLRKRRVLPYYEQSACVVQEVGYIIPFHESVAMDPLSLVLSLRDEELDDPRVAASVDEMLEEYVW